MKSFGKEDTSYISRTELRSMLISHFRGICRMIKMIYFNEHHPQNNTIKCVRNDTEHIWVYEEGSFTPLPKDYVLDTIIFEAWRKLVDFYTSLESIGKLASFKESLVCSETWDRIEYFINQYDLLCKGHAIGLMKDIRKDVYELILKNMGSQPNKPSQKKEAKKPQVRVF